MAMTITINLNDTQEKIAKHIMADPQEWIVNALTVRAAKAINAAVEQELFGNGTALTQEQKKSFQTDILNAVGFVSSAKQVPENIKSQIVDALPLKTVAQLNAMTLEERRDEVIING